MREQMTKTEHRILDYLVDYLSHNTYQPSIREIGKRFSIKSTKTVSEHLQALADKGYIERQAARSRGVKILDLAGEVVSVPSYGKIAAGQPALLPHHIVDRYKIDPKLARSPDTFILQISGESMEGMGMLDGDLVMVDPVEVSKLENGDIIAARLGGEATVKRYFSRDGKVVLEPANPGFAPMFVHEFDDFAVLGRVTGLFRKVTSAQTKAIGG